MKIIDEMKLDYEDVLIRPCPTELASRSEVNLEVSYITKHSKARFTGIPVCVANMDTVGTINMAKVLYKEKIWVALHKFIDSETLREFLSTKESRYSFVSMGISDTEIERIKNLSYDTRSKPLVWNMPTDGICNICIDAANAYMYSFLDAVKIVREMFPNAIILAGNVCTPEGVDNVIKAGADIVKCGTGSGEKCNTKQKTGVGYKQLSVAIECGQAANELNALCCSDGGCKTPGDICKSLGAGSHLVMCASLFSGTDECDSEWEEQDGIKYMKIYGMSSKIANDKYFGGLKSYRTSEGKEGWVKYKGSCLDVARDIKGSLASCCTYTNTKNLENLYKNCVFTR